MIRPQIFYTEMDSPIGPLTIVATTRGLCNIEFGQLDDVHLTLTGWLKKHYLKGEVLYNDELLQPVVDSLNEYFTGKRRSFDLDLDLYGTPFQKKIWQELLKVEYGTTKSYKDIAQAICAPKAIRAIGTAIGRNPLPIIVPCHRVIGSNGALVGYNGGLDKKQKLLTIENALAKVSS